MFRERLITAFILLGFVFAGIAYLPFNLFSLICALLTLMGGIEWTNLMGLTHHWQRFIYLMILAALLFIVTLFPAYVVCAAAMVVWMCCAYFIMVYPKQSGWINPWTTGILGCFIFPSAWLALVYIRIHYGAGVLLAMLFLVWAADTGAYFCGRLCGRRKLIPQVSPGKTLEGLIGGVFSGVLSMTLVSLLFSVKPDSWPLYLLVGLVTSVFSVVGDLNISMFKRKRQIKDSGNLLPGHGGLLDRIDSLMAAAPCFLFGLFLIQGL